MIIFDTETTGLLKPDIADLASQPHIIEIAMIKVYPHNDYKEADRYSALIHPGILIDEEVHKRITGLTNADLEGMPTFLELYDELAYFFLGEGTLVAHNLQFDLGCLVCELRRIGKEFAFPFPFNQICTVDRTKHVQGKRLNLQALYQLKMGRALEQKHRAMSDVEALLEIVKEMGVV